MKIGLDLDGVIYPWHYAIYRYFRENNKFSGTESEFWDYFRNLSPNTQEYYVLLPELYSNTIPSRIVWQQICELSHIGEVFYITSRDSSLIPTTRKFFSYFDVPFKENLIFSKDKSTVCRLLGIDYFLDDLPENVKELSKVTNAYLMAGVHNRDQREGFKVVNSIHEFYNIIEENI